MSNTIANRRKEAGCVKVRYLIVILATFCPIVCYISRINLSQTIVAMVNKNSNITEPSQSPEKLTWDSKEEGRVLGSFFYTYVLFQIPAGRMAEIVGAKWVMAIAGLGSAVLSFVSPAAARLDSHGYTFMIVRALMGICQTAIYPAGYILYTKWLPSSERMQALPVLYTGAYIGSIIANLGAGYLCGTGSGWPLVFYVSGAICAIWSILWILFAASEPRFHKFISIQELDYIETNLEQKSDENSVRKDPSFKKILTNIPIWAMISTFFSSNWSFTIVMLLLPTYLDSILGVDQFESGTIISILLGLFCITSPIAGTLSTYMIQTRAFGLSRLQTRKLFEGIALYGQSICFILLTWSGKDNKTEILATFFIMIALYSLINGGEVQLPSELTLDFAGTVYALTNCIGSTTGFIVPGVHASIVTKKEEIALWNTFWYMTAAVTALGTTVFIIFGKNNLQDFERNKRIQLDALVDSDQKDDKKNIHSVINFCVKVVVDKA